MNTKKNREAYLGMQAATPFLNMGAGDMCGFTVRTHQF